MEKKIGERFVCEVYGELEVVEVFRNKQNDQYQVSLGEGLLCDCDMCVFEEKDDCWKLQKNGVLSYCCEDDRFDNKDVYFVKVGD